MRSGRGVGLASFILLILAIGAWVAPAMADGYFCDQFPYLCTDPVHYPGTEYVGHDEPALNFYSTTPGSGNSVKFLMTLPKDPVTKPNQSGTGGTWNFELHPAFWFGMALCDTQSFPENLSTPCPADSDSNIFDNGSSAASDFIGNHPGTAFMELQFYPPGWVIAPNGLSCSATKWCAAINIDSFLFDPSTGLFNNSVCESTVGDEPVNFAYITKSGNSVISASPLTGFSNQLLVTNDVFEMKSGDTLEVRVFDTNAGLQVVIRDLNTGKTGSMTASTANGFAQVNYQPFGSSCTATSSAFHPMYSTSTPHTRVPWSAHSYNVAFSDEIGHFELCGDNACNFVIDADDPGTCIPSDFSSKIKVGACIGEDSDFNGPSYLMDWAGTSLDSKQDIKMHAKPIAFNASFIGTTDGVGHQYDNNAFETDLPSFESFFQTCDTSTGANCFNPPTGAAFYPFFSTTTDSNSGCVWQLGGADLANNYTFDGNTFSDSSEFGALLPLVFPSGSSSMTSFDDFQRMLVANPCAAALPMLNPSVTTLTFKITKVGKMSAGKTVKLTNSLTNKLGLGINNIVATLDNTTDFTISKNTCANTEVLPKKHCSITVKGTPSTPATVFSTLRIKSESSGPEIDVIVSVTGT